MSGFLESTNRYLSHRGNARLSQRMVIEILQSTSDKDVLNAAWWRDSALSPKEAHSPAVMVLLDLAYLSHWHSFTAALSFLATLISSRAFRARSLEIVHQINMNHKSMNSDFSIAEHVDRRSNTFTLRWVANKSFSKSLECFPDLSL